MNASNTKVNKGFRFLIRLLYLPVNAVSVSTDALLVGDDRQVDLLEGWGRGAPEEVSPHPVAVTTSPV